MCNSQTNSAALRHLLIVNSHLRSHLTIEIFPPWILEDSSSTTRGRPTIHVSYVSHRSTRVTYFALSRIANDCLGFGNLDPPPQLSGRGCALARGGQSHSWMIELVDTI